MPTAVGGPAPGDPPARAGLIAAVLILLVALALTLTTSSADAEEVFTSQAAAANATDSTWIPEPATRAALCIVDTGNDPNSDTTNVIARFSVDGGDPGDLSPDHHGTRMSMIASAPYNGWGMVGAAPNINIVSVRASRDGRTFGGNDLTAAVQICINKRSTYNIKVVSLSLGGAAVAPMDEAAMVTAEDTVERARRVGVNVVAAAGNHDGPVDWPAAYAPVLAVGSVDDGGARCSFSASGPEVDLWASGCPVDVSDTDGSAAWASGTSESTAFVAGVLTQLRQSDPSLGVLAAESLITSDGMLGGAGRRLDVGTAYRAGNLGQLLDAGHVATPGTSSPQAAEPVPAAPEPTALPAAPKPETASAVLSRATTTAAPVTRVYRPLAKPIVTRARLRETTLHLTLGGRPSGADVVVAVYARTGRRALPQLTSAVRHGTRRLRIRVRGSISQVSITYRDPTGLRPNSAPLLLHPRKES